MSEELVSKIREELVKIPDPHMGISIVEMGIVGDIEVNEAEKTGNNPYFFSKYSFFEFSSSSYK